MSSLIILAAASAPMHPSQTAQAMPASDCRPAYHLMGYQRPQTQARPPADPRAPARPKRQRRCMTLAGL